MIPASRADLKQYCLNALGQPITDLELDDSQLDDRIDEALILFQQVHYAGSERCYLKHVITSQDITNEYLTLSPLIVSVVSVLPIGIGGSVSSLFNIRYQLALNDLWDLSSTSLIPYVQARTHINLFEYYFAQFPHVRFNQYSNILNLDTDWTQMLVGQYMAIECHRILDPATAPALWGDHWLTSYTTALFKRQLGQNLSKYQVPLLGGVQVDGKRIYDEAMQEIKDLREELLNTWTLPPEPQIG